MARRSSLTSQLYRVARLSATGRAVRTGKPGRRAKNDNDSGTDEHQFALSPSRVDRKSLLLSDQWKFISEIDRMLWYSNGSPDGHGLSRTTVHIGPPYVACEYAKDFAIRHTSRSCAGRTEHAFPSAQLEMALGCEHLSF